MVKTFFPFNWLVILIILQHRDQSIMWCIMISYLAQSCYVDDYTLCLVVVHNGN